MSTLKIVFAIKEAWDSVSPEDLVRLIQSMPARCQAVIDAAGEPT
ncbi:Bgt-50200 [Blumeria graminis f. sp. tritici]|uniref:Bgt-50200 n=1 Tax=Blumeria graminis f. sp. tritici TaxID=62690 RepID=A0A9X9MFS8_BLUGR|nr:Bgt-50200 [Blumeria graminis f. sp. tritici]